MHQGGTRFDMTLESVLDLHNLWNTKNEQVSHEANRKFDLNSSRKSYILNERATVNISKGVYYIIMYSSIIEIEKTVPGETLAKLRKVAEKAFSNRAGSVENTSNSPYRFVFRGQCHLVKY